MRTPAQQLAEAISTGNGAWLLQLPAALAAERQQRELPPLTQQGEVTAEGEVEDAAVAAVAQLTTCFAEAVKSSFIQQQHGAWGPCMLCMKTTG